MATIGVSVLFLLTLTAITCSVIIALFLMEVILNDNKCYPPLRACSGTMTNSPTLSLVVFAITSPLRIISTSELG